MRLRLALIASASRTRNGQHFQQARRAAEGDSQPKGSPNTSSKTACGSCCSRSLKPQVTVNLTVFVGSRHEGYGEAGMAHLLSTCSSRNPGPSEIPKVLRDHDKDFNGTTWLDRTNYFETLPASDENLEFAIRLEADRMVNSYVKVEDLAKEMTVVRNEFERGENSPSRILDQRMMSACFEWHNYGKSTIGNRADIERVPVDSLKRFYERFTSRTTRC